MINTTSKLYDNFLSIYKTQYDKHSKNSKKRVNVPNKPKMLVLNFDRDDLSPMTALEDEEEVELEPEETIAQRVQLNPRKKKSNRTRIKNLDSRQLFRRFQYY